MSTKAASVRMIGKLSDDLRLPPPVTGSPGYDVVDPERLLARQRPFGLRGRPLLPAFIERQLDRLHQAGDLLAGRHVGGARADAQHLLVEIVQGREPARKELAIDHAL